MGKRFARWPEWAYWARDIVAALAAVLLVTQFVCAPVRVSGTSMRDTLLDGEIVFTERVSLYARNIRRGDIVVCRYPGHGEDLVKRVVALPGESFEIRAGAIYVEGAALDEPYIAHGKAQDLPVRRLAADEYMVLGDNRAGSVDGRVLGPIAREDLHSKVRAILWPPRRWSAPLHIP